MAEIPNALVKDLLSTGYFFEELKSYDKSQAMDLPSFSRGFAAPHLARQYELNERSGRTNRSRILSLAAKLLEKADDDAMADTIFGLKRLAASEVLNNEKAFYQDDRFTKSELVTFRRQSESAQSLGKLLISIIRIFKLTEVATAREPSEGTHVSVDEVIKNHWKPSAMAGE